MAGAAASVATFVSGFTISGVTVLDLNAVPGWVNSQSCPVLMPDLFDDQFLTGLAFERVSFGDGLVAKVNLRYDLTWVLLYKPIEENVTLFDNYAGLVTTTMLCLTAFLSNQTPGNNVVDFKPVGDGLPKMGVVRDPTGAPFWGAKFKINCLEFAS